MLGIDICQVFQIHVALDHQVSASLKEIGHKLTLGPFKKQTHKELQ